MACSMLVIGGITVAVEDHTKTMDVLLPLLPTSFSPPALQMTTELVDNAAHFKYYQNESNIIHWYEWWYLNVKCGDGNNLLIQFFTFGDLNNPLLSFVGIGLLFMKEDGTVFRSLKTYPCIQYSLDYDLCNVTIDDNSFRQDATGTVYTVTYSNPINDVALNLTLLTHSRSITALNAVHKDEWMSWNVAVPLGIVTGSLYYHAGNGEQVYNLSGRGYHDHNWGIARKLPLEWDWGEFSDEHQLTSITYGMVSLGDQPFVGGLYFANATANAAIYIPDLHIEFLEWDTFYGNEKPIYIHFYGSTDGFTIDLFIKLLHPYSIASIGNFGRTYLMGKMEGAAIVNGTEYRFGNATGFYEHHFFNFLDKDFLQPGTTYGITKF